MANPIKKFLGFENSDKRYFPRWQVQNRILYQLEDNQQIFKGQTKDLSCAGACLAIHEKLLPRQNIKVTIFLSSQQTVYLKGEVCWFRNHDSQQNHIGVAFDNIPSHVQEIILDHAFQINPQGLKNQWFKGWSDNS